MLWIPGEKEEQRCLKKYVLTVDRHLIVQASLVYGFVQVANTTYDTYPLNQQGRLTILPSVFGVMGVWYGSKTGLYVANVDGYTKLSVKTSRGG